MSWIGKIIGATLGFMLGGPLGAIAGIAFGHALDQSEGPRVADDHYSRLYGHRLNSQQHANMTFFIGTFSILAKLTQADGTVSDTEKRQIESFIDVDLRLDPASRQSALRIFQAALHSNEPFDRLVSQFYGTFNNQPGILDVLIDIMLRVSLADGKLSVEEERLIDRAARMFRFSDDRYKRIRSRYIQDTDKYYSILECRKEDSEATIKKNYRRLVSEFHPDKIAAKGLPQEFAEYSAQKFRDIQEAYEAIRKDRGF